MKLHKGNIGVAAAYKKITAYCAYQERCHSEVKEKLFSYELYPYEVEELLAKLIADDYLNEERFAIAFSGGKFRVKKWGRIKISHELKSRKVSAYCIKKGLMCIDETDYLNVLRELAGQKKSALNKEKKPFVQQYKIKKWLLQKGYESDLIDDVMNEWKHNKRTY